MSIETVREYLGKWGKDKDILEMDVSTATVPLAAQALGVIPARIAKSISLQKEKGAMVLVVAGDAKIDNRKFKDTFHCKAKMLSPQEALEFTGHPVGGVCPFGLPGEVEVYLDESMRRFETVFPACGSGNSAIEMTMEDLERHTPFRQWVDVCKLAEE